jgi:pimeloyl-ACP methyl ester carboxylesterase
MRLMPASSVGTQIVNLSVDPNNGGARTGEIQVCGATLRVEQAGLRPGRNVVVLFTGFRNWPSREYPQEVPTTDSRSSYGMGDFSTGMPQLAWNIVNNPKLPGVLARAFTFADSDDLNAVPPPEGYFWPPQRRSVHVQAREWLEQIGLTQADRLYVVGHSYGGNRAYLFARDHAIRPAGLFLIDPINYDECSLQDATGVDNPLATLYSLFTRTIFRRLIYKVTATGAACALPAERPGIGLPTWVYRQEKPPFRGFRVQGAVDRLTLFEHTVIDGREEIHQAVMNMILPGSGDGTVDLRLGYGTERFQLRTPVLGVRTFAFTFSLTNNGRILALDVDAKATFTAVDSAGRSLEKVACVLESPPLHSSRVAENLEYGQSAFGIAMVCPITAQSTLPQTTASAVIEFEATASNTSTKFKGTAKYHREY